MLPKKLFKKFYDRLKIIVLLLIAIIFLSQPNKLFASSQIAKIGMISMEATHDFRSTLTTKINAVKPLIIEAGNQNLDLVALPEAYFRGQSHSSDAQDLSDSQVLDSMEWLKPSFSGGIQWRIYCADRDGIQLWKVSSGFEENSISKVNI